MPRTCANTCVKCLAKRDEASLFRGAFILSCIGTAEDLPEFKAAFDFAVKAGQGKPIDKNRYPRCREHVLNFFRRKCSLNEEFPFPTNQIQAARKCCSS